MAAFDPLPEERERINASLIKLHGALDECADAVIEVARAPASIEAATMANGWAEAANEVIGAIANLELVRLGQTPSLNREQALAVIDRAAGELDLNPTGAATARTIRDAVAAAYARELVPD